MNPIESTLQKRMKYSSRANISLAYFFILLFLAAPTLALTYWGFRNDWIHSANFKFLVYITATLWIVEVVLFVLMITFSYFARKYRRKAEKQLPNVNDLENLYTQLRYGAEGDLYDWPAATSRYNGNQYSATVWQSFLETENIPDSRPLVIFSPSAATGINEKRAFQFLLEQNVKTVFILSDATPPRISDRVNNMYQSGSSLEYAQEPIDVIDTLHKFEQRIPPFRHDPHVIWDLKGGLWHALDRSNTLKHSKEIMNILEVYYQLLSPCGVVLIDAYVQSSFRTMLNLGLYQAHRKLYFGYAEDSTYQKLYRRMRKDRELQQWIENRFEISDQFGKNKHKSLVLIKK